MTWNFTAIIPAVQAVPARVVVYPQEGRDTAENHRHSEELMVVA